MANPIYGNELYQSHMQHREYLGEKDGVAQYKDVDGLGSMSIEELQTLYEQLAGANTLGNMNDEMQAVMQRLQYMIDERNNQRDYERSLPQNQIKNLMAAGMSRSAAMSIMQNGGVSESQNNVSPFQPVNTDADNMRTAAHVASTVISSIVSIANLPIDIAAKAATTKMLNEQGNMLASQHRGMEFAAHFEQACANAVDAGKLSKDASLSERLEYFRNASKLNPMDEGYDFGSYAYSTGGLFQESLSNPFFYSFIRQFEKEANSADASLYEPMNAIEQLQSMMASRKYVQSDTEYLQTSLKILQRQDLRESLVNDLQLQIDQMRASNELGELGIDYERIQNVIKHISEYTFADYQELKAHINQLSFISDPVIYNQQLENLRNSEKYTAGLLLHANFINDVYKTAIEQQPYNQDYTQDLIKAAQDAMLYRELYGGRFYDQLTGSLQTGSGIISSIGNFLGAFKGTAALPTETTIRSNSTNKNVVDSYVESYGERTVRFHKYPHRIQD